MTPHAKESKRDVWGANDVDMDQLPSQKIAHDTITYVPPYNTIQQRRNKPHRGAKGISALIRLFRQIFAYVREDRIRQYVTDSVIGSGFGNIASPWQCDAFDQRYHQEE